MTGHDGTLGTLKGVAKVCPKAVSSNMAGLEIHHKWSFSLEHMDNPLYRLYMSFLVGASSINVGIVHCHVWLPEGRRVSKNYSCEEREEDGPWSYWTCGEGQAKHVSELPPPGGFLCHGGSNKLSKSWMTVSVLKSMVTWGSLILRNAQMKSGDVLEQFPTPSTQASVARVGHQPGWKGNRHGSWWEHWTCCIPRAFPGCKQTLAGKSPINGGFLLENHRFSMRSSPLFISYGLWWLARGASCTHGISDSNHYFSWYQLQHWKLDTWNSQ